MASGSAGRLIMPIIAAVMLALPVLQTMTVATAAVPRPETAAELNALLSGEAASHLLGALGEPASGDRNRVAAQTALTGSSSAFGELVGVRIRPPNAPFEVDVESGPLPIVGVGRTAPPPYFLNASEAFASIADPLSGT